MKGLEWVTGPEGVLRMVEQEQLSGMDSAGSNLPPYNFALWVGEPNQYNGAKKITHMTAPVVGSSWNDLTNTGPCRNYQPKDTSLNMAERQEILFKKISSVLQ
jgi:hypothetical protein